MDWGCKDLFRYSNWRVQQESQVQRIARPRINLAIPFRSGNDGRSVKDVTVQPVNADFTQAAARCREDLGGESIGQGARQADMLQMEGERGGFGSPIQIGSLRSPFTSLSTTKCRGGCPSSA